MHRVVVVCMLSTAFATSATAAEHGVYAGAAVGESSMDIQGEIDTFFDDEDTVGKLFVGWRPLDWVAVEGGYVDLGQVRQSQNFPDFSDFRVEHEGYDVFGVFLWDIAVVDLFAKVGLVSWSGDLSLTTLAGPVTESTSDTDYAWGLGAQARFGKLALRLEYEHFETIQGIGGMDPPDIVSVGVVWTF